MAELLGCGAIPLGELFAVSPCLVVVRPCTACFTEPLLAVGIDAGQHSSEARHQGQRGLDHLVGGNTL
jgi:hypothetical protein